MTRRGQEGGLYIPAGQRERLLSTTARLMIGAAASGVITFSVGPDLTSSISTQSALEGGYRRRSSPWRVLQDWQPRSISSWSAYRNGLTARPAPWLWRAMERRVRTQLRSLPAGLPLRRRTRGQPLSAGVGKSHEPT